MAAMMVLDARCAEGRLRLTGRTADGVAIVDLDRLDVEVGPQRHCIGTAAPCPEAAVVQQDHRCLACFRGRAPETARDRPECVFEPACAQDPAHCACSFGPVDHVVYVAFHGLLPKVGMTQARRVEARLREQGADAYFVAEERPDRATCRLAERRLAMLHRLPEWRSHKETLPQLARPVPWPRIEERARALQEAFDAVGPLHRLEHPLPQPLPGLPRRVRAPGRHAGRFVGQKGPHLVYEEAPRPDRLMVGGAPLAALERNDLVGRHIELAD